MVERVRRVALLEDAVAEDGDAVAHRHRLDLVVGHVHGGDRQPRLQLGELGPRLHAQLGVEVRERLVHQVDLRMADDGPAHRDTLALAAREVLRLAIEVRLEVEDARRLADLGDPLGLGDALLLEGEAHVLGHGQLRVEGVVLEDHGDVAVAWAHGAHVAVADEDRPAVERLEPGEHPQRRRLARAGRADEHEQLAVGDLRGRGESTAGPVGAGVEAGRRRERALMPRSSPYLIAPMARPRIIRFWASQPARTTGRLASTEAADSLARKSPRVLMFVVTQIGTVEPPTGLSCTA